MTFAEPFARRLRRRALTIPGMLLALGLSTVALPASFTLALAADLIRPAGRRSLASVRLVLFLQAALLIEILSLSLLGLVFVSTLGSPSRRAALTWRAQRFFTAAHLGAVKALFSLRIEIEGAELAAEGGPVVVLMRHASIVDVLLPAALLANRHRIELRYVLKRELLAEPCLDVAGHWIPNHFVARDGSDSQREIAAVRALKAGIGAGSGVLIYPEGTRFTAAKRARLLERLADDPAALARTERLRHLLPIRPGGSLALLDAEPHCDVLFVGHAGLEGLSSIADIWADDLAGRTVRVRFWREPAASIPEGSAVQLAWLTERWQRMDDWLESIEQAAGELPALTHDSLGSA